MSVLRAAALILLFASTALAPVDPKTAFLERSGWDALGKGNARVAADAFREALRADPRNARLHLGASLAAYFEKRDADARDEAVRALALDGRLTQAREVLAQALHRLGDLAGAIRAYEEFVSETPADNDAKATLERWQRDLDLHNRMRETIGAHFTVAFEGPAESVLAKKALQSLDKAYWRIGQLLGTLPTEPIPVVLYTTQQFSDITRSPAWAAGAFDGIIRVPMRGALDKDAELDRVLVHEFTHALVHTLAERGVPAWLNEGLATVLESEARSNAEQQVARDGTTVPLSDLRSSFGKFSGQDATIAYGTSAIAVRRIIDEVGGFAVANLLRDLGEGADFADAFLHRFQRSFTEFQR